MKKTLLLLTTSLMISSHTFAEEMPTRFQAVAEDKAVILQEGEAKMSCPKCTKKLSASYKTNHVAHIKGKVEQFCSIHCLAETMAEGEKVTGIQVVDNSTLKFIDIIKAWYVVGSSKEGTLTKISKYAFGKKHDATKFAKEFGGKVMTFSSVLASVKTELEKEAAQIAEQQAADLEQLQAKEELKKKEELKRIEALKTTKDRNTTIEPTPTKQTPTDAVQ